MRHLLRPLCASLLGPTGFLLSFPSHDTPSVGMAGGGPEPADDRRPTTLRRKPGNSEVGKSSLRVISMLPNPNHFHNPYTACEHALLTFVRGGREDHVTVLF